jgi:hypothetical protein
MANVEVLNSGPDRSMEALVSSSGKDWEAAMIQDIGLYAGEPDFPHYAEMGMVTAVHEASSDGSPSVLEVNAQLQAEAVRLGADSVIRINYTKTVGCSWRQLKADGIAVKRVTSPAEASKLRSFGSDTPIDENGGVTVGVGSYSYCG